MDIYDALGSVLEKNITVKKIDVVLGVRFVCDAVDRPRDEVIARYKRRYRIDLYSHDFDRAEHIKRLYQLHVFDHEAGLNAPVTYFTDTLSVMYEWIGRHRPAFGNGQVGDAYRLFLLVCRSHWCRSVLNLNSDDCEFLFNHIYTHDFIDPATIT